MAVATSRCPSSLARTSPRARPGARSGTPWRLHSYKGGCDGKEEGRHQEEDHQEEGWEEEAGPGEGILINNGVVPASPKRDARGGPASPKRDARRRVDRPAPTRHSCAP